MNTCPPIDDLAWRMLEGELDEVAEEELALHLQRCPACRAVVTRTVRTHRILIQQGMEGALGAARQAVARQTGPVIGRRIRPAPRSRRWNPAPLIWTGGILAAATLVVAMVLSRGAAPQPPAPPVVQQQPIPVPEPVPVPAFARLLAADSVRVNGFDVNQGTALIPGSSLEVAPIGRARIELADGSVIAVAGASRLDVRQRIPRRDGTLSGVHIDLAQGELAAQVAPQRSDAPLVFRTPLAEAVVVGTELTVRHRPHSGSELSVASGKVLWQPAQGQARLVPAGAHARTGANLGDTALLRLDSLAGIERNEKGLVAWRDARNQGFVAHPASKTCLPIIVTSGGRQTVGFCDNHQRLVVDLGRAVDLRQGLTVLLVLEPQGSDNGEHIAVLTGDGMEKLGLVRNGLPAALQLETDGRTSELSQPLGQGIWNLACRVHPDGGVELLRDTHRLVTGRLKPTAPGCTMLYLGGDAKAATLSARVYACEVHTGTLSDAALDDRFRAIAKNHAISE